MQQRFRYEGVGAPAFPLMTTDIFPPLVFSSVAGFPTWVGIRSKDGGGCLCNSTRGVLLPLGAKV